MAAKIGAAWKAGESLPKPVTRIDVHRYYFQGNDVTSTSLAYKNEKSMVQAHDKYGCRTFSISFKPNGTNTKPFTTTANIARLLASFPSDVDPADILVSYYHEHDGNLRDGSLSIANYKAGSKQLADVAHQAGCRYGPIHNGVNKNAQGKWGLWPEVWKQNEADTGLYDFWGTDCYSIKYEAPSPRMDVIKTYADSLGLPVLIGEMGCPAESGSKQESWCKQARTWAVKNSTWAMYWSSQVSSSSPNYRLSDTAAKNWFGI